MGAVAGLRAIHTAGLQPDDIDVIILATLSPDYWMPSTAALVKEAIGNTKAFAFDVAAACSGFVYAYATASAFLASGPGEARPRDRRGAAHPVPRLHRPEHLHPVRRRGRGGGAVGVGRARRAGRHGDDHRAAGRVHDLAARRRVEEPAVAGDDRPRRAQDPDGGQGDVPVRDADPRLDGPGRGREGRLAARTTSTSSSRTRPTSGSSRPWPRAWTCRWTGCTSTSTSTATPRPRPCRSPSPRPSTRAGSRSATRSCSSRSGPASRPARWRWSGPRTRSAAATPMTPSVPRTSIVRLPVDWDSVDPIPPALAEILARPLPVELDLSDVVPGEPERVHQPVR